MAGDEPKDWAPEVAQIERRRELALEMGGVIIAVAVIIQSGVIGITAALV